MSSHSLDNQMNERLVNEVAELRRQFKEIRTLQTQGEDAIQIGYTPDTLYTITMAPNTGLIGTFLFVLEYDTPPSESVVFGDVDIAVNVNTDTYDPVNTLSAYYGGLKVEVINDLYLEQAYYNVEGYHPVVKVIRLYTTASSTTKTFYIHARWRYVGVGRVLVPATGDISIIPTSS
jgi:hypothetical protein